MPFRRRRSLPSDDRGRRICNLWSREVWMDAVRDDRLFIPGLEIANGQIDGLVIVSGTNIENSFPIALVGQIVLGPDTVARFDISDPEEAVICENKCVLIEGTDGTRRASTCTASGSKPTSVGSSEFPAFSE